MTDALDAVLPALRCPVCTDGLGRDGRTVRCVRGHAFDVARQGYVNLLVGRGGPGTGDSAAMVAARTAVLAAGVLDPVVAAVADAAVADAAGAEAAGAGGGLVADLAGGTGQYLAAVLDRDPAARGLVLDNSPAALRRAAGAHPRAAAVGADAWASLPVRDAAVATVLSVFGPRNPDELRRVLAPGGVAVVAAPRPDHLAELVDALGLVRVDPAKDERQAAAFAGFELDDERDVTYRPDLDRTLAAAVVGMGPSARHLDPTAAADALPDRLAVTVSVRVTRYRR